MKTPLRLRRSSLPLRSAACLLTAVSGFFVAGQLAAQGPALAMLDRLQPGLWELRERDSDGGSRQLCVTNGRKLIQIRHPGETCQSFVIEDTAGSVTVQYTCQTSGYGRTHIRYENPGLVQIDTQGIARGRPFDFSAEARRIGSCAN